MKGFARLTRKKELDSKIDRKNEEIRILKAGLSGIVRQYGYQTVQDFYKALHASQETFYGYQEDCAKWDESYGEKTNSKETFTERIQRYQMQADEQNAGRDYSHTPRGRGAR